MPLVVIQEHLSITNVKKIVLPMHIPKGHPADAPNFGRLLFSRSLTLYSRDGFGPAERRAIDSLHRLHMQKGRDNHRSLRLLLVGMGSHEEYVPLPLRDSAEWISATPYIGTKHAKNRGRNRIDHTSRHARTSFLIADLRRQLALYVRGVAGEDGQNVVIEPLLDENLSFVIGGRFHSAEFRRRRTKLEDDSNSRMAGAFRLIFPEAVRGPVAFGRHCHFSMGLFLPYADNTPAFWRRQRVVYMLWKHGAGTEDTSMLDIVQKTLLKNLTRRRFGGSASRARQW